MILKTRQGRYRVKVKDHGVIVADRTFTHWNDAEAWEADGKRHVAETAKSSSAISVATTRRTVPAVWSV
jgi:hypothetical protein